MGRERRRAVLHFDRAGAVKTHGVDRKNKGQVLSLLAILFKPGDEPSGEIEFVFSGQAGMRVGVECVEAQLADMAASWEAQSRPDHGK
jgi:hypothetical protein